MSEKKKSRTYQAWRGDPGAGEEDVPGFCVSANFEEITQVVSGFCSKYGNPYSAHTRADIVQTLLQRSHIVSDMGTR